jgi:hypothetical protein
MSVRDFPCDLRPPGSSFGLGSVGWLSFAGAVASAWWCPAAPGNHQPHHPARFWMSQPRASRSPGVQAPGEPGGWCHGSSGHRVLPRAGPVAGYPKRGRRVSTLSPTAPGLCSTVWTQGPAACQCSFLAAFGALGRFPVKRCTKKHVPDPLISVGARPSATTRKDPISRVVDKCAKGRRYLLGTGQR